MKAIVSQSHGGPETMELIDSAASSWLEGSPDSIRSWEGGFQANTRIPLADGLSTFTGLLTCQDLKLEVLKPAVVENLVSQCLEFPKGGFRDASWDEHADGEYTFHGLGNLGLLCPRNNSVGGQTSRFR